MFGTFDELKVQKFFKCLTAVVQMDLHMNLLYINGPDFLILYLISETISPTFVYLGGYSLLQLRPTFFRSASVQGCDHRARYRTFTNKPVAQAWR